MMENINNFQQAIKAYGVADLDVFQTVDLWEKKDIAQVTNTLFALGRQVIFIIILITLINNFYRPTNTPNSRDRTLGLSRPTSANVSSRKSNSVLEKLSSGSRPDRTRVQPRLDKTWALEGKSSSASRRSNYLEKALENCIENQRESPAAFVIPAVFGPMSEQLFQITANPIQLIDDTSFGQQRRRVWFLVAFYRLHLMLFFLYTL